MTCYFRHIRPVFDSIGVEVTDSNKREIDKRIHDIAGIEYKNCSATWKRFKELRSKDEEALMMELKEKLADFSA
ncbi:hypothetical protein EU537_05495 [Candidatus Thorarchaeota archaeon]|nr:MAG: hypothetical protein EU537_05495 [Candidatus Thorarchaeota archaeon]